MKNVFVARLFREDDDDEVDSIHFTAPDFEEARRIAAREFRARHGRIDKRYVQVQARCRHPETSERIRDRLWAMTCDRCGEALDWVKLDKLGGER